MENAFRTIKRDNVCNIDLKYGILTVTVMFEVSKYLGELNLLTLVPTVILILLKLGGRNRMVGGTGTGTGRRCKAKNVDISMKCDVIEMESVPAVKHHHHHHHLPDLSGFGL